ncbi:hypothetical protein K7X08_009866 [Anisodus acutangulus]|uniref:malate dehydrogenase n=1 Tax=Anisodus acutangulus TaxID=402998 RepID=A0A9Q1N438_9SOLA|nr:hypothetical protein K7X08_009866 [Anisodus acutangulus]
MEYWGSIEKPLVLLGCAYLSWKIVRHIWSFLNIEKDPITVLVTGAAGQIGYALVPMIARGAMLGLDQPVIIHMLDIEPAAEALKGVKMELIDAAFPLLKDVVATTDAVEACKGVNVAVMVGGFPRKEGMERKDVMSKNVSIYKAQASALEQHAAPDCKVLVVANPANTNALILKEFAPSFPARNITCLTRLDHNRALGQVSERLNVHVGDVRNVTIWGNHSSTQYPDVNHATVNTGAGEKPVRELVADDQWLNTEFITTVQQRGAAIIKARKLSSALSAASSACDHIRDWVLGTPKGTWVSMGVYSDGSYGIPAGLIYSFPVTCEKGEWSIVQGLKIDEFSRARMDATSKELVEEKSLADQMDDSMKQLQEKLIEVEIEGENLLLARQQLVENDRVRNGNRESLTALRRRAKTTKTSVRTPFESIMRDVESRPLVKEVCTTCGNHDSKEKTWVMFPGTDIFANIPFHAAHTILEKDQTLLDYEAKKLQSLVKEKSLWISEQGVLADRISPGVVRSMVTLSDKPKTAQNE